MAEGIRISNAAKYPVIAIVHEKPADKQNIQSLTFELRDIVRLQVEMANKVGGCEIKEVLPGMARIFPERSIPFGNVNPYVTILVSEHGMDTNLQWVCINYIPPSGRCIIVEPTGGFVLAKKGKHWTAETGGYCYNQKKEVSDDWWCIVS